MERATRIELAFSAWEGRSAELWRTPAVSYGRSDSYPHASERRRTAAPAGYSRDEVEPAGLAVLCCLRKARQDR